MGVGDQVIGVICAAWASLDLCTGARGRDGWHGRPPEGAKGMAVLRAYSGWGLVFLTSSGLFLRNGTSAESSTL